MLRNTDKILQHADMALSMMQCHSGRGGEFFRVVRRQECAVEMEASWGTKLRVDDVFMVALVVGAGDQRAGACSSSDELFFSM